MSDSENMKPVSTVKRVGDACAPVASRKQSMIEMLEKIRLYEKFYRESHEKVVAYQDARDDMRDRLRLLSADLDQLRELLLLKMPASLDSLKVKSILRDIEGRLRMLSSSPLFEVPEDLPF